MDSSLFSSRKVAWTVWLVASVFYAYQYILRVMPNVMLGDIMQQFGMNATTFGQFSGIYYIGYSLMHLPVGILLDRYGPRKVMTICTLLTVLGVTPLLLAHHWIYPVMGRLLMGIGSSAAILGVFKIIRMTFKEEHFPRMLSLSVTIGLVGAIYGGAPVSFIRELLGYQVVIQILAAAGVSLAAITYWIVPEVKNVSQKAVSADIKEVLSNSRVVLSCIFAGLMVGPLEGFADVWGSAFLKQVYGFDSTVATTLPSMIFMGMCFGAPVLSLIADKIGSYLITIIAAGIAMILSFSLMLSGCFASAGLSICFAMVGICCAYQVLAIYKASTYAREQVAGLTTAVANMIIMIFGYGFHTAIGGVVNFMGGPKISEALMYGMAIIPIALFLGTSGFILLFIWEKRAKGQNQTLNL